MRFLYRVPTRPCKLAVWNALSDAGALPHMDDARHALCSDNYALRGAMLHLGRLTEVATGRALVLGAPIPLDQATRAQLLADLEEQRSGARSRV
jgi:hypothetical protein